MTSEDNYLDNQTLFAWAVFGCQYDLGFPIVENLDSSKEFAAQDDWSIFENIKDSIFEGEKEVFYNSWSRVPGEEAKLMAEKVKFGEASGRLYESIFEALFLILLKRKEAQRGLSDEEKERFEILKNHPSATTRFDFQAWLIEDMSPDNTVLLSAAFSRSLMVSALCVSDEFYRDIEDQLAAASLLLVGLFKTL